MSEKDLSSLGGELVDALKEVKAHMRGEIELPSRIVHPPKEIDVASIRKELDLSQRRFAERFGFSVSAIRDWEQGRRHPDRAARLLLWVISRETDAVERALAAL